MIRPLLIILCFFLNTKLVTASETLLDIEIFIFRMISALFVVDAFIISLYFAEIRVLMAIDQSWRAYRSWDRRPLRILRTVFLFILLTILLVARSFFAQAFV